MDTELNVLFGVLAYQADLITLTFGRCSTLSSRFARPWRMPILEE